MKYSRLPKIEKLAEKYEPPSTVVILSGREVTVYKMSLVSFTRVVRQAEPYIKEVVGSVLANDVFTRAAKGEIDEKKLQDEVRGLFMAKMGELIATVPEAAFKIVACIMNIDPDDEESEITQIFWGIDPGEIFDLLEKLDELNDFIALGQRLVAAWQYLGRRYGFQILTKEE